MMTSPNESDRKTVRDTLKEWGNPQTVIALLMLGYQRDMVREEFQAFLELTRRIDENLAK